MENKIIHQIFFEIKNNIKTFPRFLNVKRNTEEYCRLKGYEYKFWSNKEIYELLELYPEFKPVFDDMMGQEKITKRICGLDLIRYLILYHYGGIYLDLDVDIVKNDIDDLFNKNFIVSVNDDFHISVMGFKKETKYLLDLIKYSSECYYEKKEIKVYETWLCRFESQTTGSKMIGRFVKKYENDIEKLPIISFFIGKVAKIDKKPTNYLAKNPYFIETNQASWWVD